MISKQRFHRGPLLDFIYKFIERAGSQIVSLFITIVLARIISVEDYGAIEIILVFISICQIFVQNGLNAALIQKHDSSVMDFSSAFYLNLLVASALYFLLFVSAPAIEAFYSIPCLSNYLRICALILFPNSYNSIQNAYMSRYYMFNKQMICNLVACIFSGIIGVLAALKGLGIWAYITYQMVSSVLTPAFSMLFVSWRPGKIDSLKRIVPIYKFGISILVAGFLETIYNNVSSLIIGKKFTTTSLAYYSKGKQFPQTLINIVNGSLQTISLPYLSRQQKDIFKIKEMVRKLVKVGGFAIFPIMFGLAAVSRSLIIVLLTDKWLESAWYLKLACFMNLGIPIYSATSQAMNAIGRSDVYLRIEMLKKLINIISIVIAVIVFRSIDAILLGQIIVVPINVTIGMIPCKKYIGYKSKELLVDVYIPLLFSAGMYIIVTLVPELALSTFVLLFIQIAAGITFYCIVNVVFKNKNSKLALSMMKDIFAK